jgi:hypothetical protein
MRINANTVDIPLSKGELFSIANISQVQINVPKGNVWITIDDDIRDSFLCVGKSFTSGQHKRAIVSALEASTVRLLARSTEQRCASSNGHASTHLQPVPIQKSRRRSVGKFFFDSLSHNLFISKGFICLNFPN